MSDSHMLGCHHPPPGLAFGEPDGGLQRMIQYAAASRSIATAYGILDRPVEPGDDNCVLDRAA
jgi:hypothetical protein